MSKLTPNMRRALEALRDHGDPFLPATGRSRSAQGGWTRVIAGLYQRGLIEGHPDHLNRARLTDKGRQALQEPRDPLPY